MKLKIKNNFYIVNRQKLLLMVKELHQQSFGKLKVIPSFSPSGVHWRCTFIAETNHYDCIASNWINKIEGADFDNEIKLTVQELAILFVKENSEFIEHCKGTNEAYEIWYTNMLEQLKEDELPYAYADWEIPKGVWLTTNDNEIKKLPNE